jgi:cell division protein FtsQ
LSVRKKRFQKNRYKNSPARKGTGFKKRFVGCLKLIAGTAMVISMSFMFIFCHDLLTQCDYFKAKDIEVLGHLRLTEHEIVKQAQIYEGENTLSVNLSLTRARLLEHPWIAEAEVRRVLPSKIIVSIKEHTPIAIMDVGRNYLLNSKGQVFKKWEASDARIVSSNLAVVKGLDYSDLGSKEKPMSDPFGAVMDVLTLWHDNRIPGMKIKTINVDREIGLTLCLYDQIRTVRLGYDDYPKKYDRLKDVFSHLSRNNNSTGIDSVDLKSLSRIVVKPNNTQPPANKKEV